MAVRAGAPAVAGFDWHGNGWTGGGKTLTTGDGLEVIASAGAPKTTTVLAENNSATGAVVARPSELVRYEVGGSFAVNANWNGPQRLVAGVFGLDTETVGGGATAYDHILTIDTTVAEIGTFCYADNGLAHDFEECKIMGFEFQADTNSIPRWVFDIVARQELVDDSGANTLAGMVASTVTLPACPASGSKYLDMSSAVCVVRTNALSGGGLGAGDKVHPSAMKIKVERPYRRLWTTRAAPYIDVPEIGARVAFTGSMTFPKDDPADSTTVPPWATLTAGVEQKMDIVFTSPADIGGGDYWKYNWEIPCLKFLTDGLAGLDDPDLLEVEVPFIAYRTETQPTGMAFNEPRLTITDTTTTDWLA